RGRRRDTEMAHRDAAELAKEMLARRFAERLTLSDIATSAHVSSFHLCRIFRRHTGLALHQYLTQIRLRRSLEILGEGHANITELALSLGFSSHAHFTSAFSRAFGMTPSAVRGRSAPSFGK